MTPETEPAYGLALQAVGESLGWVVGASWEPMPGSEGRLRCTETWAGGTVDTGAFEAETRGLELAVGQGLPGRVWASGRAAWIEDVRDDDTLLRRDVALATGLRTAFAFPVRATGGEVLGVIELFTDAVQAVDEDLLATMEALGVQVGQFTERRNAEERLQVGERRMHAIIAAALDCVITMDQTGRVVEFNPSAEETFGIAAADAIGRDMADLVIPPESRETHRRGLRRLMAGGDPVLLDRRIEVEAQRVDGRRFPCELTITRIALREEEGFFFTGYLRDITERVRAEEELRASRTRIVEAADAARRRIERDLHDGAQQRLVGLALSLRLVRGRLEGDPAKAAVLLDEAIEELAQATAELRELARGIHPAVLSEGGLEPALRTLVTRSAVPARLVAVPERRLPAAVEAAAYFVVAEALTNVTRYAQAARADVEVVVDGDALVVTVTDDGIGGADPEAGSGLRGLADRLAALDASLSVVSPTGDGTILRAELPCAS